MNARYFILFMALIFPACAPTESGTEGARQTLADFFDALHDGRYADALALYGGDYTVLMDQNPGVDPGDRAALWRNACQINGAQCLPVRSASLMEQTMDVYRFTVEFDNPDGALFVLGPCCGGNEADFPPVSQFEYRVRKQENGKFVVLDLPVYIP